MDGAIQERQFKYIVIGGGITGVSVVEKIRSYDETGSILMITESDVVQAASKVNRITLNLEEFIIVEKSFETFRDVDQMLVIIRDKVVALESQKHALTTENSVSYGYEYLCICTGGSPQLISYTQTDGYEFSSHILGIRDTKSVAKVSLSLSNSSRVLVVGNGGIATEFVYETKSVDIVWAVKDASISSHYFDNGAACFLLASKQYQSQIGFSRFETTEGSSLSKRLKYTPSGLLPTEFDTPGSALGPDWHNEFLLHGLSESKSVDIQYKTEVQRLFAPEVHYDLLVIEFGLEEADEAKKWRTYVELTNGKRFGVDWILSATGVRPNTDWFPGLKHPEHGIYVNDWMHSSLPDVYAAGDVCYPSWPRQKHWFQMRLWSQGRTMGICAGISMSTAADSSSTDNSRAKRTPTDDELMEKRLSETMNEMFGGYDIFTHVTKFFGFKVVLLGLYNGQGIPKSDQRIELRCTPSEEYIKIVIEKDKVQGAVLIGDTNLEETFENMILGEFDVSKLGDVSLLDPNIDLEDFFD